MVRHLAKTSRGDDEQTLFEAPAMALRLVTVDIAPKITRSILEMLSSLLTDKGCEVWLSPRNAQVRKCFHHHTTLHSN